MLKIVVPRSEFFDERTNEFIEVEQQTLQLEHSLVSISKWEAKWKKPFLAKEQKTKEEILDYVRCMTINQNIDPNVYLGLSSSVLEQIFAYMEDSHTATIINELKNPAAPKRKNSSEFITSELVYYWMVALQIPFECQKWNFNRLMTLIRICEIKNGPKQKMSKSQILSNNHELNKARRQMLHTKG